MPIDTSNMSKAEIELAIRDCDTQIAEIKENKRALARALEQYTVRESVKAKVNALTPEERKLLQDLMAQSTDSGESFGEIK